MENSDSINDTFYENTIPIELEKTLRSLGILPIFRGYQYILDAELMIIEDSNRIFILANEVYPSVAARYFTTASRVERAIRHAIEISWSWCGEGSLKKQYAHDLFIPTNKQFLDFLHQRILESIQSNTVISSDCLT